MIWMLKGPGPEMAGRRLLAGADACIPAGKNTHEEAEHIAEEAGACDTVYVVTSGYHVPRATLTVLASLRRRGLTPVLHVWGDGTLTNAQAQSEAQKLVEAQAKGHALRWEDV